MGCAFPQAAFSSSAQLRLRLPGLEDTFSSSDRLSSSPHLLSLFWKSTLSSRNAWAAGGQEAPGPREACVVQGLHGAGRHLRVSALCIEGFLWLALATSKPVGNAHSRAPLPHWWGTDWSEISASEDKLSWPYFFAPKHREFSWPLHGSLYWLFHQTSYCLSAQRCQPALLLIINTCTSRKAQARLRHSR